MVSMGMLSCRIYLFLEPGAFCAAAFLGCVVPFIPAQENTIVQICGPSHQAQCLGSLGSKF